MIKRLVVFVLATWAVLFASSVSAAVGDVVKPQYRAQVSRGATTYPFRTSPAAYCVDYAAAWGVTCTNPAVGTTSADQTNQAWTFLSGTSTGGVTAYGFCDPAYYSTYYIGNVLWCKVVTPPPADCTDKNLYLRRFYYTSGGPYIAPDHYGGCIVAPVEMKVCRKDPSAGTYCYWSFKRTGDPYVDNEVAGNGGPASDTATQDTSQARTTSPPMKYPPGVSASASNCGNCVPCPAGTVQAGSDSSGIPICMGTGTDPADAPKTPTTTTQPATTTTNSDGSTTTVQKTVQANADGSTTTTTTTTTVAADGTKTVSVGSQTSSATSGAAGVTDTPNSDQYDLCKQHPTLTICQNSSVAGSCAAITCTGDAIQCATLKAAAQMQCQQAQDLKDLAADPNSTLGKAVASGADPKQGDINTLVAGTTVDLSQAQLDQSGWLGGGSCLAPITIQAAGRSISASFDSVCSAIAPIRAAVLLIAFIISYLLISRSVLQS